MLQALNTGHAGSLSTIHSNSPEDAVSRLEVLVSKNQNSLPLPSIRQQIVSAIDLIVQLKRLGKDRLVTEVSEVEKLDETTGLIRLRPLYQMTERVLAKEGRPHVVRRVLPTGRLPTFIAELLTANQATPNEMKALFETPRMEY